MFSLAVHEIQSAGTDKEYNVRNDFKPSNVRIHGTMCRKILPVTQKTPVRHLIVDPEARLAEANAQTHDLPILKKLEQEIIPKNPNTFANCETI